MFCRDEKKQKMMGGFGSFWGGEGGKIYGMGQSFIRASPIFLFLPKAT